MSRSLAFATDLVLRAMEGAEIERGSGATVVRTAGNPGFQWGNFLLVPSADRGPAVWETAHRAAFPDADFTTIGVDDGDADLDEERWIRAGFSVERLAVLAAEELQPAAGPAARPLRTEADWRNILAIEADEADEADDTDFAERRLGQRRAMVASGGAIWLAIEVDGTIVSTLGIADAGGGIARFQDVQTLRAFRRRGYAGALVAAGAQAAVERFGSTRFVIVAEADGPAIGLYRRLGFQEVETQVQLSKVLGETA